MTKEEAYIRSLILGREKWEIVKNKDTGIEEIVAFGETYPLRHPVQIYLKRYRLEPYGSDKKYDYMKAAHDYLWPHYINTWHYWTERRFRAHCDDWNYLTLAGGAGCSKSRDMALIGCLFWHAYPRGRGVVVSSTTLESLGARIWGYVCNHMTEMKYKLPFQYLGGNTPKIIWPVGRGVRDGDIKDLRHGMFAVAAKSGSEEKTISSLIGRHPDDELMMILDECTDMPAAVSKAFANLDMSGKPFQLWGIGNSNSVDDLHGSLSTPAVGWNNIKIGEDVMWKTTQKKGVCLYFDCYESPAIHESDPEKKKVLSKFLITADAIESKRIQYGEDSDSFWRFCRGFWRLSSTDSKVISKEFIETFGAQKRVEWGGVEPLRAVAGLDPAFSSGGDECILRIGILGYDTAGNQVLDFKEGRTTFSVPILRSVGKPADIQIAEFVVAKLEEYRIPIQCLCIDATGQGRALGGVIQLQGKYLQGPIRIYSTSAGLKNLNSFDTIVKSTYQLWYDLRTFIEHGQIRGLDTETILQLSGRLVELKNGRNVLESKSDYKRRMAVKNPSLAHSPDKADAAALAVQAAVLNYGFNLGKRKELATVEGVDMGEKMKIHLQQLAGQRIIEEKRNKGWDRGSPKCEFKGDLGAVKFGFRSR